ncbi:MAG: DNA repair protein RadA [Candidatus Cloacimonas sp. 4484_275]|nr:MAG: DNA repair protein RadA [Candidatus Cloacimonas sp. 4484_275]
MFFCKECGAEVNKWSGKCPVCGAWNSLRESSRIIGKKKNSRIPAGTNQKTPEILKNIELKSHSRFSSQINEFDGVLGGGIIPGMVVLIGGEPGIGKSTLMLQISSNLAKQSKKVLYVSGEESPQQIKIRSKRLNCVDDNLFLLCNNQVEDIIDSIMELEPELVIIDSIQSVYRNSIENAPGSVSQMRESTASFTHIAKTKNIPIFLIGHVTKEGIVAGPKIIEHMVDTVLYFEGETKNFYKILRTTKNRFGSTNEIGLFEMLSNGLKEIRNPSQLFLNKDENNIGSAVGCMLEGSRAFLVEVQALVSPASYGTPQRVSIGFDYKKLALLLAIIEKNLSVNLRQNDVFINIAGGIKVSEPALDLAIIAAIISSFREVVLPPESIFLGEIGLNGDVRSVSQIEKRIKEARKLGYRNIILSDREKKSIANVKRIKHIGQLLSFFPLNK